MKENYLSTLVQNSELGLSGRISTCLFSVKSQLKHACVLPSLRVGRFLIYLDSREPLKEVSEVQAMLHRMLISLLTFHLFLKITSNRNIPIPKVLAFLIRNILSVIFWRSSNEVLLNILLRGQKMGTSEYLMYLFPHMLLIDISLSSKDILVVLLARYYRICNEFAEVIGNCNHSLIQR